MGVMEVWTRPRRSPGAPAGKPPSQAMSLLFSLTAATEGSSSAGEAATTSLPAAGENQGMHRGSSEKESNRSWQ